MQWLKQSTAVSKIIGPILDSTGVEYASAVIGDLSLSKNGGTLTALAATATLTYIANGMYTLALTTGNTDTLGSAEISCNKSTYQMPPREFMVLPSTVYDALTTNATTAAGGLGDIQRMAGTALTARDIGVSVLVGDKTGFSLTQTFPTNFSSLGITAGGHITNVDICTTNSDMRGTDNAMLASSYAAPLDASSTRAAVGLGSANLDTQLFAIYTVAGLVKVQTDKMLFNGSGFIESACGSSDFVHTSGKLWTLDGSGNAIAPASDSSSSKTVTDKLDTALVLHSTVYRFTADALSLSPAPSGVTLADGSITEATFATPAETVGRPTGILAMIRRLFERTGNKRKRTRSTGLTQLYGADNTTLLESNMQSTTDGVDQITESN